MKKALFVGVLLLLATAVWSQQVVVQGDWLAIVGPLPDGGHPFTNLNDACYFYDNDPSRYRREQLSYDQIETLRVAMGKYPAPRTGVQYYAVDLIYYYNKSTVFTVIACLSPDGTFLYRSYRGKR
jgi:hypothetical protein